MPPAKSNRYWRLNSTFAFHANMNAEILAIGDEITSGQRLDTNSPWLSRRLAELGIRTLYHTTVGDELDAGVDVFRQAIGRADIVIATGGLGPTADDLTRDMLAGATGTELALDPQALEHIRALYARRNRPMPKRNELQALFPTGSRMIPNPHGTAPGIAMEVVRPGKKPSHVFTLPGVPAEMKEMWTRTVSEAIGSLGGPRGVIRHHVIKCFGVGESSVEAMLPDLIRRGRTPTVGITAQQATIVLRVTALGATEAECHALMEPTVDTIRECLGDLVFGEGDDELQDAVVHRLQRTKKTLSTAEWGTGGLVAHWLDVAQASDAGYLGGVIVSNRPAVERGLNLGGELLDRHAGTSPAVARAMAEQCRRRFKTDYALAVAQFPKFDPEADAPELLACALAGPDGVEVRQTPFATHPALLRILAAKHALNLARLGI